MMKKYLMTGMAAVAICAAFTSCSKDEGIYDPEQVRQNEAAQIVEKYNQAFVKVFGTPSADQDWGFGASAGTRASINVNGNLWESCPSLGENEEADVTAYVRALTTYNTVAPSGLVNYYVTQVHCGTDTYTDKDNNAVGKGSSKMNHLMIAMQNTATITNGVLEGDWVHINNFNRGDDTDWNGNTLVTDGGTFDFAYIGSEDSKYHNKWCAVDGASISSEYAGYYYICFDFEQSADAKTVIKFRDENNTPYTTEIDGAWDKNLGIDQVLGKTVTVDVYDWQTQETTTKTYTVGQEGTSEWELDNVKNGNQMVDADNDYTDWIIRLVKAQPKNDEEKIVEPDENVVRIIAEDLSASDDTDFDFNDVVFDVTFNDNGTATVQLVAAGGTLPLTVDGHEVHEAFGYSDRNEKGLYNMINTGAKANVNGATASPFTVSNPGTKGYDIKIMVNKFKLNEDGSYTDNWIELTAKKGVPAAKLCVNQTYEYCSERESIKAKYPNFSNWVLNKDYKWW